jgi:hypothetical protein
VLFQQPPGGEAILIPDNQRPTAWYHLLSMKKSTAVNVSFLASVAAAVTACGSATPVHVHLNASGQCISDVTGEPVDQRICYGYQGGHVGGVRYVYVPTESAPYYSNPTSPGYINPSNTVRGIFGESAESAGHGGEGESAGAHGGGEGAGE